MTKEIKTYEATQYDDIEKLMDDANKLISHPNTRKEGMDILRLVEMKIKRETNRMIYARMTGQRPNIPPLEPAPSQKLLGDEPGA